ncbi:MAG: gliding motility-associated ABC transporter substrate-binding protein GldG [Bacteroidota bacterium]|nr:gliding motility-associated ABC transporter substrate-binding protein GldG [Bacteroidota bacterium]MDP3145296.1 gliding motility-associated ABC transporter substrate-binding protein GldG [Bacteroidota bacterium]MDP3557635.1 gliding motility-associated ABC transporter substrate-binding protein GldG [Bacteroidota bacterium]
MVADKKIITSKNKRRDIASLFVLIAIVILVNFIGSFYFKRFDLTSEKRYTLAESTKTLLKNLDDEVYFKVYFNGDFNPSFTRLRNEAKEILDEFRAYSGNQIQYEFITPGDGLSEDEKAKIEKQLYEKGLVPEPIFEKTKDKTTQSLIWPGAIVSHKGREAVWKIFNRQDNTDYEVSVNNSVKELEYSLTNTIRKLQRHKKQEVTFIEGHYELDTLHISDFALGLSEYYEVNKTPILGKLGALDNSDAIIIAQPDSAFSVADQYIIDQYIMKGGKVLWLIDPVGINKDTLLMKGFTLGLTRPLNLDNMLFKYGVRLNSVLLQDFQCSVIPMNVGFKKGQPNFKLFPWPYSPLVLPDGNHPIVKNLDLIKLDYVSSLDTITARGIKKTILLSTSRYTKTIPTPARINYSSVQIPPKESQFLDHYIPVACLLEGEFTSFAENRLPSIFLTDSAFNSKNKYIEHGKKTKMIVVADGDIARNEYSYRERRPYPLGFDIYSKQQYANKTFLLNCVNYLLDDEGMLQLRSREVTLRLLDKKKISLQRSKWQITNVLMPVMLLIAFGLIQFFLRKRKFAK